MEKKTEKTLKKKQTTLGAFGFVKKIMHRGELQQVDIPKLASDEAVKPLKCDFCEKKFINTQGLSIHMKCIHSSKSSSNKTVLKNVEKNTKGETFDETKAIVSDVLVKVVEKVCLEVTGKKKQNNHRQQYTAVFKAKVISHTEKHDELTTEEIACKFGINKSMVSRWMKSKIEITSEAVKMHRRLLTKNRKPLKYKELHASLLTKFKEARAKGHRIGFEWLWSKARQIRKEQTGTDEGIGKHVIVQFLKLNDIRMRKMQRNKKKSKESFRDNLKVWHAGVRERLLRTGFGKDYDTKWGRFLPEQRINVDQSPLPFAFESKKTYDIVEKKKGHQHNTWIAQPGSGLDKRQCTLQVCVRPVGKQPPIAVIFRGKGKKISDDEKGAWHPDVNVYFQENAWADGQFCIDWVKRTLKKFVEEEELTRHVLFADNLTGQCMDQFKQAVSDLNGVVWYGLPSATDLWQPVDAGYAQLLKVLISKENREWLDCEENADRWFGNVEKPFSSKERRILLTHWIGKAYNTLCTSGYDNFRKRIFQRTGCLMTADGSEDHLVKPEGLADYELPPVSILNPNLVEPISNVMPENTEGGDSQINIDYQDLELFENDSIEKNFELNEEEAFLFA